MMRMFSPRQVYTTTKHPAHRTHAERDISLLIRGGFVIRDRDGVWIVKDRYRLGYADPVLRKLIPALLSSSHSNSTT
jgi:hypothetical protein